MCITLIVDKKEKKLYYSIRRIMAYYPILLHRYGEFQWTRLLKYGMKY
jgi:hypothetical protein